MCPTGRTGEDTSRAEEGGRGDLLSSPGLLGALAHRRARHALAWCFLLLSLVWTTIAARLAAPDGGLHVAWGMAVSILVAAFGALAIRAGIRDAANVEALQGSQRQRARLETEREFLSQLVHNASDTIISRSVDGTILSWNPAAAALFGYTAEEAVGQSIEIIVPPENLADHRARRNRSGPGPREVVRMAKDGRRIDIELSTGPIHGPGGDVIAVSVIARDITAAKQAQAALRASEERLREAQRLAHMGSWELDLRTQALTWSDEIYRIFELDPSAFGASYAAFLDRVHPEDRKAVDHAYHASVSRREPYSIDHRLLMADGRIKHVHEECTTEYDAAGHPLRSVGTVQDITERKRAEVARAHLAAIVESANDAIIGRTLDGNVITSWNPAAERLFGYAAAEVVGRPMAVIASAWPRRIGENTERLKAGDTVPAYESLRPHRDGTAIPVMNNISPIRDEAGGITGVAVVIRDLREEKRAQEQRILAASVFEHAAEGIIVTNAENRIVSVNRAFTRITGYEAGEVIGKNPRILASGMQSPDFYRALWKSLRTEGLWQGELWDKRRNGELYCQSLSITAIADAGGAVQNYCAIFMDITRRKNAELALMRLNAELEARVAERTVALESSNERLRQANEELNAFSYSVSHDLRGPLRRVHGYATMALEAVRERGDVALKWLERIKANTEEMSRLVEDLLRLSRISGADMAVKAFDLTALALDVVSRLREHDALRRVDIVVDDGISARGDPSLVQILLENLIGNAWKFTAGMPHARIQVGRLALPEITAYYVRDNGAGFDMKRAADLFRPFSRLHAAEDYEGTGVGLTIVQRIVSKHGGRVWAEGEPGRGATFYFTLAHEPSPAG